jgi:DNA-binding transcriptional ArsR family regulator
VVASRSVEPKDVDRAAEVFSVHARAAAKLLSDFSSVTRLRMLCLLLHDERSVGELCESLKKPQPSIRSELMRLQLDRIVTSRREGRQLIYSIADKRVHRILSLLNEMSYRP